MPVQYVKLWDAGDNEVMMPMPYKKTGGKYLYGPEANGVRRKPRDMKPTIWRKLVDGFTDLFSMIKEKV